MSVFNQSRSRVIRLIILIAFAVIIAQLFNLQVLSSDYKQLAMNNAVHAQIVYPERGIINDRTGKPILSNEIMFDLMVIPSQIKGMDTTGFCQMMEIDTADFNKRIIDGTLKNSFRRPSVFQALLSPKLKARFEENAWKFPGFTIVERPVRSYPFHAAAHILGYVNEVSKSDIEKSNNFYRQGDYIGKSGLESFYEDILMGQRGVQYLIKDNFNRLVGSYEKGQFDTAAIAGRGLQSHIDIELQQLAEKLFTDKVGAVVAIEPKTGGILAMASGPTFDPNELTGADKGKNYSRMLLDVSSPLMNRAIQGRYEPGSTFKPLGALVALDLGLITPTFGYPCFGRYNACGSGKPACTHSNAGHAGNLRLAIANSCNSYFTHIYRMVVDNKKHKNPHAGYMEWRDYMHAFGLGTRLGVDLPNEVIGNIPDTSVYNKEYRNVWGSCTNLTLGIGQDKMQVTPLQLANSMCIVANKGYYYTPHIIKSIENETAEDKAFMQPFRTKHEPLTHVSDTVYNAILNGMEDVTIMGTAKRVRVSGVRIAAKTGTAENYAVVDGRRVKLENNAVFVAIAPKDDPKIAIAVIVQNAGYGGSWGGPISKLLIEKYLNDTLSKASQAEVETFAATNKMPKHFKRLQEREDSIRAYYWFGIKKDSSLIRKYLPRNMQKQREPQEEQPKSRVNNRTLTFFENRKLFYQPYKIYYSV